MVGRVRSVRHGDGLFKDIVVAPSAALRAARGGAGGARQPDAGPTRRRSTRGRARSEPRARGRSAALARGRPARADRRSAACLPAQARVLRSVPARRGLLWARPAARPTACWRGRPRAGCRTCSSAGACWALAGSPSCWSASGSGSARHALPSSASRGRARAGADAGDDRGRRCSSGGWPPVFDVPGPRPAARSALARARARERGGGHAASSRPVDRRVRARERDAAPVRIYEDLRVVQRRLARAAGAGGAAGRWPRSSTSGTCRCVRGRYFRDLAENNRIRAVTHPRPARAARSTATAACSPRTGRPSTCVLTPEHSGRPRPRRWSGLALIAFDRGEAACASASTRGAALPPGGGQGGRERRGRRHRRGAPPGGAGGQRRRGAAALLPAGRRPPPTRSGTWARSRTASCELAEFDEPRAGHRRGPGRARVAVQPRAHGQGRPAAHRS